MNPILQALNNQTQFNGTVEDAKNRVIRMIESMTPQQKASFSKILPLIGSIARSKGVDTSALSELQSGMQLGKQ